MIFGVIKANPTPKLQVLSDLVTHLNEESGPRCVGLTVSQETQPLTGTGTCCAGLAQFSCIRSQ